MRNEPAGDAVRDIDGEHRSVRKRRIILEAATNAFLQNGYPGTSMDEIAARAAVSKQTVYKQFADKERLFSEIVLNTVNEVWDPFYADVLELRQTRDLERDLRRLARRLVTMLMEPRLLQLRRVVIGEAGRFPQLGRTFYERGPGAAVVALTSTFEHLEQRGLLVLFDDAVTAARHFNWLVVSTAVNVAMFTGDDQPFAAAELKRQADAGVRTFLAAYGTTKKP